MMMINKSATALLEFSPLNIGITIKLSVVGQLVGQFRRTQFGYSKGRGKNVVRVTRCNAKYIAIGSIKTALCNASLAGIT